MGNHHRIVVNVDHMRVGRDSLGDLVDAFHRGQARADVEELGDSFARAEAHRAAEETAVLASEPRLLRNGMGRSLGRVPVGCEVVFAARVLPLSTYGGERA
jgi:hypothetical protein